MTFAARFALGIAVLAFVVYLLSTGWVTTIIVDGDCRMSKTEWNGVQIVETLKCGSEAG